jgi:hypothetical protein
VARGRVQVRRSFPKLGPKAAEGTPFIKPADVSYPAETRIRVPSRQVPVVSEVTRDIVLVAD